MRQVEVFRTNVSNVQSANKVLQVLSKVLPACEISFDLDDCDKVMRIAGKEIKVDEILKRMNHLGYDCEILN